MVLTQSHKISDTDLVRRIQTNTNGSPKRREAVGILYDRYYERIFRYLWVRLNNHHEAEDLAGEVFTRMMISLPRYKDRKLPFQAWLYRIAHNLLIDQYRKDYVRQTTPLEETEHTLSDESDLAANVEEQLLIDEVRTAIENLDAVRKDVIVLRFLIGLPIREVALILDKSVPAIKALQHRGLRDLRTIIENA
jgi:RNA polymerase sigma-70 factor (ECF subfamily)